MNKTTTCSNLGIGLVWEGKKELLVDCYLAWRFSLVNVMSRETILLQYLDTVKHQYDHILNQSL